MRGEREAAGSRGASRRGRDQTQDWARCCPLRFPVVRGGCRTVLLREAVESREPSAGRSVSPLFSSPPFAFSSSFLLPPSPFYSLILLGIPSCGPVAFSSTTGLEQWLAQGAEGWSGHDHSAGLFPWWRRWRQRRRRRARQPGAGSNRTGR